MSRITITRSINALVDLVFGTVAHISEFSKAVPHIVEGMVKKAVASDMDAVKTSCEKR